MERSRPIDEPHVSAHVVTERLAGFPLLETLIKPFCPPYYRDMEEAVLAFVDRKYGQGTGAFRDEGDASSWQDGSGVQAGIPPYSDRAIAATIEYCNYVYERTSTKTVS